MRRKPSVYITGPDYGVSTMFARAQYTVVPTMDQATIHVWTGGSDVDPEMYGEKQLPLTSINRQRDFKDSLAYNNSYRLHPNALRVGICRGAQFLNVKAGGKLWQDVDSHCEGHDVQHLETGELIYCSSTHHQQMVPAEGAKLIGIGVMQIGGAKDLVCLSNLKVADGRKWNYSGRSDAEVDPEVVWYERTKALCFQPHPELRGYDECTRYFFGLVNYYHEIAQSTVGRIEVA